MTTSTLKFQIHAAVSACFDHSLHSGGAKVRWNASDHSDESANEIAYFGCSENGGPCANFFEIKAPIAITNMYFSMSASTSAVTKMH